MTIARAAIGTELLPGDNFSPIGRMLRGNDAPYHTVSHPQAGVSAPALTKRKRRQCELETDLRSVSLRVSHGDRYRFRDSFQYRTCLLVGDFPGMRIPNRAKAADRHFLHGLLVGIVNSVWVTGAHILFFSQYIANHPKEAAMMTTMPLPNHPRLMMACVGPIVGVISGLIIGLFALVAGKIVKPTVNIPA